MLADVELPGDMTGHELANRVRQIRPGLKVVYTSQRDPETVKQTLPPEEEFGFIPKPFTPEKLIKVVRESLDHCS
jgi:DNA-binding NtrC family response regulator